MTTVSKTPMQNLVQQKAEVAATVTAASAGSGLVAFLADLNVVLVTLSTAVALAVGVWTLYDRYKARKAKASKEEK